ncbi:unnamed protein product [Bursaphelenchus xylophilus]|uniref:(pine wood nematode) hypothetical protein n=1 Tax=Bursaphelenchus xylophilus TaxID=6326 RepID=A0A1I7SD85_BURXY|nr:unnamed protein product [Bursaphelenchus xylophilus]CAG9130538.1 unnamed protein product [Bursaphelenchus xylophilus]
MAKKKVAAKQSEAMAERVAQLQTNPVFHEMPKREKKVKLDPRFQKMFSDERFASTSSKIDRRGRPVNDKTQEELKNIYEIDENSTSEDEKTPEPTKRIDLARGEGNVESSSDEEDSSESEDEVDDVWGELDSGVRQVDWTSSRISVCQMDWDKIKAEDIFMALESFKPASGVIKSVAIYLSDFGAQKLEEEDKSGPKLNIKEGEDIDQDNLPSEVIRAYQLDRFKYYYAVVECDSDATASAIYEACDGLEFESSGVKFDLRFIPEEMEFEDERIKEKVTSEEFNAKKYQPKYNVQSAAVKRSNIKMEWDNTDYDRQVAMQKAFDPEADLDEYAGLIASGSDDDDDPEIKLGTQALLSAAGITSSKMGANVVMKGSNIAEDEDIEKEEAEKSINKSEKHKGLTPFQEYLQRRKQKRKERKVQLKEKRQVQKRELVPIEKAKPIEAKKKMRLSESASKLTVNTEDPRFQSLFTDSEFAIDRTHSQFKGGILAEKQVEEKRKRKSKRTTE